MIQTILFATDLGVHTPYLLHHVNELANDHNAKVVVVHAIESAGLLSKALLDEPALGETPKHLKDQGITMIANNVKSKLVDVLEEEFIDGQHGLSQVRDVRVLPGKPLDIIMEQADDCHADLIIIGSHGEATNTPNMLGSVTSKILQMSRVPVYMVPLIRSVPTQARAV